jgi:hypothetical protein
LETRFSRTSEGTLYPDALTADGAVELFDRNQRVAVRGRHLDARFAGPDELTSAEVTGAGALSAWVFADPFAVWGPQIKLDRRDESLAVNGSSRLVFTMDRTLQGRTRGRPECVSVTASQALRVNAPADKARYQSNVVVFEGDVVAATGDEKLSNRSMALLLRDAEPNSAPAAATGSGRTWTMLSTALREGLEPPRPATPGATSAPAAHPPTALAPTRQRTLARQVPNRLIAEQALVESTTWRPGDTTPVVESSLSAPNLSVDFDQRVVETRGGTVLLMISRQMPPDPNAAEPNAPATAVMGVPSGLMSRGPSQTAMKCEGPMRYALGLEGPERRDFASFEGNVVFAHVAGREMANLNEMLPQLADKPELLVKLESRNTRLLADRLECEFVADDRSGGDPRSTFGTPRGAAGPPLRLAGLLAQGNTELRDRQGAGIREVFAERIEYDAARARVAVFGSKTALARVYVTNPETGTVYSPVSSPHVEIDLRTNEVRAEGVSGEITQPATPPSRR